MGWMYSQTLDGYATPKARCDALLTWSNDQGQRRVLKSAVKGMRTYYAAVEHLHPDGERTVWAAVFLVRYNPRAADGYIFGYKDMDETCGPVESECPEDILRLLTPTNHEFAVAWRERCWARIEQAKARRADAERVKDGVIVRFAESICFVDGVQRTVFRVRRIGAVTRFYDGPTWCRIPHWRSRAYTVIALAGATGRP